MICLQLSSNCAAFVINCTFVGILSQSLLIVLKHALHFRGKNSLFIKGN